MSSLERSLQLRLSRVNQLHDLLTGTSYRAKTTGESLENLRELVQRIAGVNQVCEQVNQEFQALAEQRRDAFQCGISLVKSIRSLIFSSVFRSLFLEAHTLTLIKSLCEKIHHQKPFTAPDDLFNPTVLRELTLYENSYNALTTNYQLLLETIAQLVRQSPEPFPALGQSQTLLSRVLGLNQQIQLKQQEALRYQEERLELFRELRRCVLAIIGRSRQLFGTQSEVYRTVLKCNIR